MSVLNIFFHSPNPKNGIVWSLQECVVPPAFQVKQSGTDASQEVIRSRARPLQLQKEKKKKKKNKSVHLSENANVIYLATVTTGQQLKLTSDWHQTLRNITETVTHPSDAQTEEMKQKS